MDQNIIQKRLSQIETDINQMNQMIDENLQLNTDSQESPQDRAEVDDEAQTEENTGDNTGDNADDNLQTSGNNDPHGVLQNNNMKEADGDDTNDIANDNDDVEDGDDNENKNRDQNGIIGNDDDANNNVDNGRENFVENAEQTVEDRIENELQSIETKNDGNSRNSNPSSSPFVFKTPNADTLENSRISSTIEDAADEIKSDNSPESNTISSEIEKAVESKIEKELSSQIPMPAVPAGVVAETIEREITLNIHEVKTITKEGDNVVNTIEQEVKNNVTEEFDDEKLLNNMENGTFDESTQPIIQKTTEISQDDDYDDEINQEDVKIATQLDDDDDYEDIEDEEFEESLKEKLEAKKNEKGDQPINSVSIKEVKEASDPSNLQKEIIEQTSTDESDENISTIKSPYLESDMYEQFKPSPKLQPTDDFGPSKIQVSIADPSNQTDAEQNTSIVPQEINRKVSDLTEEAVSSPVEPFSPIIIQKNNEQLSPSNGQTTNKPMRKTTPFRVLSVSSSTSSNSANSSRKSSYNLENGNSNQSIASNVEKLEKRQEYLLKKCTKLQKEITYLSTMNNKGLLSIEDSRKLSSAIEKLQQYLDQKTKEKYEVGVLLSRQLRKGIDRGETGQFWISNK